MMQNYHVGEYLTRPNLRGHDKYIRVCGKQIDYRMSVGLWLAMKSAAADTRLVVRSLTARAFLPTSYSRG